MKTLTTPSECAWSHGARLSVSLLILLLPAATLGAETAYNATGWITGVPVIPMVCTNAAGQVLLRGNAHTVAVQSADPRLTGSRVVSANGAYQADGSALIWGTAYQQVGTFDAKTNFTETAGLWEISYRGRMEPNYSLNLTLAGYGSGGAIDGQRIEETMTRGPASGPIDLAVPYLYSGTIKPAPVDTIEVVDNFDDNKFTGSIWEESHGTCFETNQTFYAVGNNFQPTHSIYDSYVFGGYRRPWTVPDGLTLEWRADLISLDDNANNTAILGVGTDSGPGYAFHKGRNFAFLLKWASNFSTTILACEKVSLANTNVVLALALTRVGPNLVINARVLEKSDPNTVLYQHTVIDTPASDPVLDRALFEALTGIQLTDLTSDFAEAPPTSFYAVLGVFQNTDGNQPIPTAVFDNLEVRTSELPLLVIERAVHLSWPASAAMNYAVQAAPNAQGPWLPVLDPTVPGLDQMTVPANDPMRIFRLVPAP